MEGLDSGAPGNPLGDVEFDNVVFSYDGRAPVIKGFSLSVEHGQKVAVVGLSGSGKTTLMNLLMRFFECDSGDIRIDGVSIRNMSHLRVNSLF